MIRPLLAAACGLLLCAASASAVTIDWVTVGNPGNAADQDYGDGQFGAVSYTYRISAYQVTNAQYAEFLNAVAATDTNGLYNSNMDSNARGGITQSGVSGSFTYSVKTKMGDKPVNIVSWYDAARFSNWLTNGQGTGDTESGVYTFTGATSISGITRDLNNPNQVFIPTEDEWYKAAYHQPAAQGGDTDDYWLYPTGSNTAPTAVEATSNGDGLDPDDSVTTPADGNHANFDNGAAWNSQNGNVTTVGTNGDASFYGTFDQGGNLWDWNETLIGSNRGRRGGAWYDSTSLLAASGRIDSNPSGESFGIGFRVASPFSEGPIVPEPESVVLGLIGAMLLAWRMRRGLRKTSL